MHDIHSIVNALDLKPHPEGGFYKEMHRAPALVQEQGKGQSKHAYTSIYYLLSGTDFSAWHRIQSDETWFFHSGCDAVIYHFDFNGTLVKTLLGHESMQFQATIPANTWFAAQPSRPDSFFLASCVVAPGFVFSEFEMGKRADLLATFGNLPEHVQVIQALTRT